MKKIFLGCIILIGFNINAQILSNGILSNTISNSNVMIDGSTTYSTEGGSGANIGKGIIIPSVNLVNFVFDLTLADGSTFPTYFDGMIVYNNATGTTLTTGNRPSTATAVTPGFYYFSNPSGASNSNVTGGVWTAVGANAATKNVTSTEVALSTKVNGAQLYAINGTFTATGSSTAVSVTVPAGMTGYYTLVTYQNGKTFRKEIYSFDIATSTNNVICGTGAFSEVLPAGTYNYVLEYFK
jgi:hypothetical protein